MSDVPRAVVRPSGTSFDAPGDRSLLESALAAGVPLPRSCRNGTCRACLARLVAGRIRHRIEWPGLSAEEKRDGWILPCVALPCGDVVIEVALAADPVRPA